MYKSYCSEEETTRKHTRLINVGWNGGVGGGAWDADVVVEGGSFDMSVRVSSVCGVCMLTVRAARRACMCTYAHVCMP